MFHKTLGTLPIDALINIFSKLPIRDILSVSETAIVLNGVIMSHAKANLLWEAKFRQHFPHLMDEHAYGERKNNNEKNKNYWHKKFIAAYKQNYPVSNKQYASLLIAIKEENIGSIEKYFDLKTFKDLTFNLENSVLSEYFAHNSCPQAVRDCLFRLAQNAAQQIKPYPEVAILICTILFRQKVFSLPANISHNHIKKMLVLAIQMNNSDVVNYLITHHIKPGIAALVAATKCGHTHLFDKLLSHHNYAALTSLSDDDYNSLLFTAVKYRCHGVFKLLISSPLFSKLKSALKKISLKKNVDPRMNAVEHDDVGMLSDLDFLPLTREYINSIILHAAQSGAVKILSLILPNKIDSQEQRDIAALIAPAVNEAVMNQQLETIELLLNRCNASVKIDTPFILNNIACTGYRECLELLLTYKNHRERIESCIEIGAFRTSLLIVIAERGHVELLHYMLDIKLITEDNIRGNAVDMAESAVNKGEVKIFKLLVEKKLVSVNNEFTDNRQRGDRVYRSALMIAALYGYDDLATFCISNPDCDVNAIDRFGNGTALQYAVMNTHVSITRMLLKHPKIDVNKSSCNRDTCPTLFEPKQDYPCILASMFTKEKRFEYGFVYIDHDKVKYDKISIFKLLLEHRQTDINQIFRDGNTLAILAVKKIHSFKTSKNDPAHIEMLKLIVSHPDFDPDIKDSNGLTAQDHAEAINDSGLIAIFHNSNEIMLKR